MLRIDKLLKEYALSEDDVKIFNLLGFGDSDELQARNSEVASISGTDQKKT